MSGRRWIFILLVVFPISSTGCQIDGGATKMWNPFARADKTEIEEEQLPKFVRRISDDKKKDPEQSTPPIAETRVESLLADGQRALQENRITDAQRAYGEVLQFIPDDAVAHHGLAMAADLTENWAEAEDHYRQALRARPRDANLLCDIGYSYLLQNRYSEAASYLAQAIQINPNHENAHTNLALLDVRQGNTEAARTRLAQRYGNNAKVTQILAALQSQAAIGTSSNLVANAPILPVNASFEEVRAIANRERIAAEQRRAAQQTPPDHNVASNSASAVSHSNPTEQYYGPDPRGGGQPPVRFPGTNTDSATANSPPEGYLPSGYPPNGGAPMFQPAPGQFNGSSNVAAQSGAYPSAGNPNVERTYPLTGPPTGSWNQNSLANQSLNTNPQYSGNSGQTNFGSYQQPPISNNQVPPAANGAASFNGAIAVRPSGAFQPPAQGVSYGQPIGFSQSPNEAASYQNKANTGAPISNGSYNNAGYGDATYTNQNMAGQQNPVPGQNISQAQLEGLNVGPGALFPIGQGTNEQNGTLRMGNVSAPGSNSMINGAMYGQPVSALPSQEWMIQQQQQIQQLRGQSQQPNQNGQGYAVPENNGQGNRQGYAPPPYAGSNAANPQFGESNGSNRTTMAPRPGIQAPPANPLATYENQLRQLDNQYNNTLQQLDRNVTGAIPRAQY